MGNIYVILREGEGLCKHDLKIKTRKRKMNLTS